MSQIERLVAGTSALHDVDLTDLDLGIIRVRPLTSFEAADTRSVIAAALGKFDAQGTIGEVDAAKALPAYQRHRAMTVAYGLSHSGETCGEEQARQIPQAAFNRLYDAIDGVSGGLLTEDMFRGGKRP